MSLSLWMWNTSSALDVSESVLAAFLCRQIHVSVSRDLRGKEFSVPLLRKYILSGPAPARDIHVLSRSRPHKIIYIDFIPPHTHKPLPHPVALGPAGAGRDVTQTSRDVLAEAPASRSQRNALQCVGESDLAMLQSGSIFRMVGSSV